MMNFGGWQTLLQINPELDYNWNIQAHVVTVAGVTMPLGKDVEPYSIPQVRHCVGEPERQPVSNQVFAAGNGSRELVGYNIYRSKDGGDYELIDYTTETTYLIRMKTDHRIGLYCYMVSAVWESETDQCESAFSNEACEMLDRHRSPIRTRPPAASACTRTRRMTMCSSPPRAT